MMRRLFFVITFLLLSLPLVSLATITRDLTVGAKGNDVLELQRMLNSDQDTKVALSGVGAPGQETDYFGSLTAEAVKKFQNKYRTEVLVPVGLDIGTGFVGSQTRKKLNNLGINAVSGGISRTLNSQITVPPPPPPVIPDPVLNTNNKSLSLDKSQLTPGVETSNVKYSSSMAIKAISPSSGTPGTTVTITGYGFSLTGNQIYTGYSIINNVSSRDGKTIVFTVDSPFFDKEYAPSAPGQPKLSVPLGIFVKNSTGVSNHQIFTMTF